MTRLSNSALLLGIVSVLASCGMVGEDAVTVPAYICIPSYTFVTDTSSFNPGIYQGSPSEKFTDMWISDAGLLVAAVGSPTQDPMKPLLIPIQKTGPTQIWVESGIIVSGQDEKRQSYPLVSQHIETRNLKPGVTDTIYPVFKYLPNIDFKFIADFDQPGSFLTINPAYKVDGDTIKPVSDLNAWRQGRNSGKIEIAPSHQKLQLLSSEYELPGGGSPVYLEIDYKSNLPLDIGYYYQDPLSGSTVLANPVIQTYPNSTWKKLYVNLTDELATRRDGTLYIIYIGVFNSENIVPEIYIDNVKLVCLKG